MGSGAKWGDLGPRIASAVVLAAVGVFEVWAGGYFFLIFVAILAALMVWELGRMMGAGEDVARWRLAPVAGIAVLIACLLQILQPVPEGFLPPYLPSALELPILAAAMIEMTRRIPKDRAIFALYTAAILLACTGLFYIRIGNGLQLIVLLIAVVVVTDIAGYFAGRMIGGPKFWPAISPKKTWSGTIAGWVGALIVGVIVGWGDKDLGLILLAAVGFSFGSQMGDIAESAIKRRYDIKDSSNLIPGHGGVLDRFDGMIGAGLIATLLYLAFNIVMAAQ